MGGLDQILSASKVAILSLRYRAAMSLSTVLGVALVTIVLMAFLAMASGLQRTLASTGSPDVAMIVGKGAKSENSSLIGTQEATLLIDQIARLDASRPMLASAEVAAIAPAQDRDDRTIGMVLRGVGEAAFKVRPDVRLVSGRMFGAGTNEIIVGVAAQKAFAGLAEGQRVRLGAKDWLVVGTFAAGTGAYASEAWGDATIVRMANEGGSRFNSIRVAPASGSALSALRELVAASPESDLQVVSEREFFASQANGLVSFIKGFAWPIALVLAIGALVGALNTMFSSVEERARDMATLRAIGFSRRSSFVATFAESLCLATVGAALGTLVAFIAMDGFATTTLTGGMSQIGFALEVDGAVVAKAFALAVAIGALGGIFPALRGARQPILQGLSSGANG